MQIIGSGMHTIAFLGEDNIVYALSNDPVKLELAKIYKSIRGNKHLPKLEIISKERFDYYDKGGYYFAYKMPYYKIAACNDSNYLRLREIGHTSWVSRYLDLAESFISRDMYDAIRMLYVLAKKYEEPYLDLREDNLAYDANGVLILLDIVNVQREL